MAKRIGDAGMVLPDAPKLMFENALALGDAMSVQMGQLLRTSLGVDADVEHLPSDGFTDEQRKLLEEWQGVTSKARLLPKLNLHELVDSHYPIPFLATIKGVRDLLAPKPEEVSPRVIEHYPRLLEVVAEWEVKRLESVGTLVKAFADESGNMSEERYRDMHLAMAVSFYAHNSYGDMSVREAMDDLRTDDRLKMGLSRDIRVVLLKDLSLGDIEAADRCLKAFTAREDIAQLSEVVDRHYNLVGDGSYPIALFRKLMRQRNQLRNLVDQALISRHRSTEFEMALLHGKTDARRSKYLHRGVVRPIGEALSDSAEATIPPIDRELLASGVLGIKLTQGTPKTAEEAMQVSLPEGTLVDENGSPMDQPRRPVRLDLSAQVAEMDEDGLEESEEATFEDFRFLIDEYGFRGLQIGNYVPQKMRRYLTGAIHQSVEDMAEVARIPPQLVALGNPLPDEVQQDGQGEVVSHQDYEGRSLGLALGARGRGKAAAHYEPAKHIINMTRDKGAGSLAHEWGHALDYSLSELCDFRAVDRRFGDADISRVTGRTRGTGVETVSEAMAVYWTLATNLHMERHQEPPKPDEVRDYAAGLLKPERATPEAIAMMEGMAYAMKAIYAEDVSDEQLSRDHGAQLAEKIQLSVYQLDRLLVELSNSHFGTVSTDDARGKLMSEGLWPFDGGVTDQGLAEIANMDWGRLEKWTVDRVREVALKMLETTRDPHPETLRKMEAPIRHAINAARDGSRLLVRAIDHDRLWSSDEADAYLREHGQELAEKGGQTRAMGAFQALQLAEYLRYTPENERRPVGDLLDLIAMNNDMLRTSMDDLLHELSHPTPHDMEKTMSVMPAAIDVNQSLTLPNGKDFQLLSSLQDVAMWAPESHGLANGAKALFDARYSVDPAIRDSRLEVHPRLLNRIQRNLTARFDHFLAHTFQVERQIIDAFGIEDPESERPHPAVPSARARAAIHTPEILREVNRLACEEKDDRFRPGNTVDLVGYLGASAALSERLGPCLSEPTACMRFSRLIDTVVSMRDVSTSTRRRQNETEDEYQARHGTADEIMAAFSPLAGELGVHQTQGERLQWLRSALHQGWREVLYTAGEQSSRLHRVGSDVLRRDHEVGDILDKLVYRCVTSPLTLEDAELKDPSCSQASYQGLLRDLAGLADDHGARFAYMTPEERSELVRDGLMMDLDWSREEMKKAFIRGAAPIMNHNSLFHQRFHPPVADWADIALKTLNSSLHRNDMGRGERATLSALRGDYRRDVYKGIPRMQTSRMARASAAYEKRDLGRNGYLRGSAPKYWCTPVELFARAFETYVHDALEAEGRESPYLVTVADRGRQERAGRLAEAVVAKQRLFYLRSGLNDHENNLFHSAPVDYSWTYPAGHMRNTLRESFTPLVESLAAGLSQRYPQAVALHDLKKAKPAPEVDTPPGHEDGEVTHVLGEAFSPAEAVTEGQPRQAMGGSATVVAAGPAEPEERSSMPGQDAAAERSPGLPDAAYTDASELGSTGATEEPGESGEPEIPPALGQLVDDKTSSPEASASADTHASEQPLVPMQSPGADDPEQKAAAAVKKPQQVSLGF